MSGEYATARGTLDALAKVLGCGLDDIEDTLERHFWCELPRLAIGWQRLDAIRAQFDPGEGNSLIDQFRVVDAGLPLS